MTKYLIVFLLAMTSAVSAQQLSIFEKMQLRSNCEQDFKRVCPGIAPAGGALKACIMDKKDQLSQKCSDTVSKLLAKREG